MYQKQICIYLEYIRDGLPLGRVSLLRSIGKTRGLLEWVQKRTQKWSEGWSTSPVKTGWETWSDSGGRWECSEETLFWLFSTKRKPLRKMGTDFLAGAVVFGQGAMVLNWKRVVTLDKRELFYEAGEKLKQAAQRSGGCPIHGNNHGHVRWGWATWLAEDIPAHCRGVGLYDLGSFQPKLFYNSMKILFSN